MFGRLAQWNAVSLMWQLASMRMPELCAPSVSKAAHPVRTDTHLQVVMHYSIPVEIGQCVAQLICNIPDVDRLEDVGS